MHSRERWLLSLAKYVSSEMFASLNWNNCYIAILNYGKYHNLCINYACNLSICNPSLEICLTLF